MKALLHLERYQNEFKQIIENKWITFGMASFKNVINCFNTQAGNGQRMREAISHLIPIYIKQKNMYLNALRERGALRLLKTQNYCISPHKNQIFFLYTCAKILKYESIVYWNVVHGRVVRSYSVISKLSQKYKSLWTMKHAQNHNTPSIINSGRLWDITLHIKPRFVCF